MAKAQKHTTTMAFFKRQQQPLNKKWYPRSVLLGKTVTTAQLSRRIAQESTAARADVEAVLYSLAGIMGEYMAQGRSVRLDGIGTFRFTAVSKGNGVDTPEEVSANQINGVKVSFVPETTFRRAGSRGKVATRALTDVDIEWIEYVGPAAKKSSTAPDEDTQQPETGEGSGGGALEM